MKQSKITFFTSIGAGLEYYDLVIYSLLAKFISQQFFPSDNQVASLFATFGVYAAGSLVRPVGGLILGIFGDRVGRKKIFSHTLLWMGLATFIMGLIPSFSKIGIWAPILFGGCRIIQGVVFGAELPGAMTLLSEHIDPKRYGLHFGLMVSSVSLGVSLGSLINWLMAYILSDEQILSWGFRLPFLFGGVLAIIGFYIRKHLPETPKFLAMKQANVKVTKAMVKDHIWQVVGVVGILLFPATFITLKLALPTYLHDFYYFKFDDIYMVMTCGYLLSAVLVPLFGWISDYVGRKIFLIAGSVFMMVGVLPVFNLLYSGSVAALFVFFIFGQLVTSSLAASYFVLIPSAFQTSIRYAGTAFSYNIAYTMAAVTPIVVNYIYGVLKNPNYLVGYFMILALATMVSTLMLKFKKDNF